MDKQCGIRLLLLAALLLPHTAAAQPAPRKESHHEVPGGPDPNEAQRLMTDRLNELRDMQGLQDQLQGLLNDPSILGNLKQLPEPQLRAMRENLLNGSGLQQDPNWNRLIQQVQSNRNLEPKQIEMLQRLVKGVGSKQSATSDQTSQSSATSASGPNPSASTEMTPPAESANTSSWYDRMEDETVKWFTDHLGEAGGDILDALLDAGGKGDNGPLAELMREMQKSDLASSLPSEQLSGLPQYLPKMGEFLREQGGLLNDVRTIFRETRTPSLPDLNLAKPAPPQADGEAWLAALLSLSLLAALAFLYHRSNLRAADPQANSESAWRLGSWPVSPDAVSTRTEVVAAFEYLALLRLGVSASTYHHRALAERLAGQDGDNVAFRLAAETLAWLYEKARYAPADDTLSPDELTDARQALCLLAGVTVP
jgi:hypothetical protein